MWPQLTFMSLSPSDIVHSFVDRINQHDVDAIVELMTDDHLFVDGLGQTAHGRERARQAWHSYFGMVPDYTITAEQALKSGSVVGLFGLAAGTYSVKGKLDPQNRWQTPAAWTAVVRNGKVAEWRVYADNEPIREIMRRVEQR